MIFLWLKIVLQSNAHFTKEEIGQDKPIYIPSLEEGDNLVSHNLEPR